jgi:hypothetical protein
MAAKILVEKMVPKKMLAAGALLSLAASERAFAVGQTEVQHKHQEQNTAEMQGDASRMQHGSANHPHKEARTARTSESAMFITWNTRMVRLCRKAARSGLT